MTRTQTRTLAILFSLFFVLLASSNTLAATRLVLNVANSGPGSFRDVVATARPGDTVSFAVSGTIALSQPVSVQQSIDIVGPGPESLVLSGNSENRVLGIGQGATVNLSGVTIADGYDPTWCAGLTNSGTLVAQNIVIRDNYCGDDGASCNYGTLILIDSEVRDNESRVGGGALWHQGDLLEIYGSRFVNNRSPNSALAAYGPLFITESSFEDHPSGVAVSPVESALIVDTSFINNYRAIYKGRFGSQLELQRCEFIGNGAKTDGGAIFNSNRLTIEDTTFEANHSDATGGAIFNEGTLVIEGSTFERNTAGAYGGAVVNDTQGTFFARNSTFSGNSAFVGGGVVTAKAEYAIFASCTFAENTSFYSGSALFGENTLMNSIIAAPAGTGRACAGGASSAGYNLGSDSSCNLVAAGDQPNTDPSLEPLGYYFGPTKTHALKSDSPAVDAANDTTSPTVDQRGISRPQGEGSDIGAYEAYYLPPLPRPPIYSPPVYPLP